MTYDLRLDLKAVRNLFNFKIEGTSSSDEVDLYFASLVDAANFVSTNDCEKDAKITFPVNSRSFDHPLTITISNYTSYFQSLDIF